jgi:hypothetical protein
MQDAGKSPGRRIEGSIVPTAIPRSNHPKARYSSSASRQKGDAKAEIQIFIYKNNYASVTAQ